MCTEKRQWWVFTFGCGQQHENCYVKIYGTFGEARTEMFNNYGEEWAFQYSEERWSEWEKERPPYIREFELAKINPFEEERVNNECKDE